MTEYSIKISFTANTVIPHRLYIKASCPLVAILQALGKVSVTQMTNVKSIEIESSTLIY